MKHIVAALMGLTLLAGGASAQSLERVYWGVSNGKPEPDENTIKNERSRYAEENLNWNNPTTWRGDTWGGQKIYRGVVNSDYTATEVGIAFLGDLNFVTQGDRVNNQQRVMFDERSSRALFYDKVAYWGASDSFKWFGRLGLALVDTEVDSRIYEGGNLRRTVSKNSEIVLKAGAGLQWRVTDSWHIRTELENYFDVGNKSANIPESDITVISFGVLKLF